jgi:two-component system response regulator AtoC
MNSKTNSSPENDRLSMSANGLQDFPCVNNLFDIPIDFFNLLDNIAIGVVVLDLERRIVGMNQTLKALTGFNSQDYTGISCANILRSNVCLQDCPALNIEEESGSVCKEGNLINKDRRMIHIRITSAPLRNIDGKIIGSLETVEDIRLLHKLDTKESQAYKFNNIIGRSAEMEKIFQILPSLAQSDSSVLITGETGTGKDMLAETIHQVSNRAKSPFVKINCGALPETLLESELFGHCKGAFTGAVGNKPGRIQLAHNGTLYLTEIGDLPISLQIKLLTFLDDKVVFPLGGVKGFTADVRIIAATHRNLEKMVADGLFRKDLLFRLNVIRLHLPPLRDRYGDAQLLLDHFLNTLSEQSGKKSCVLSPKALKILLDYHYPGNIRELKNIVEYAVNIASERQIRCRHLPSYIIEKDTRRQLSMPAVSRHQPDMEPLGGSPGHSRRSQTWPEFEKQMIMEALIREGGRKCKAALSLGWARSTLWRKMKQYGID